MAAYTIRIKNSTNGTDIVAADGMKRIDAAMRRFSVLVLTEGQVKELVAADGTVVAQEAFAQVAQVAVEAAPVAEPSVDAVLAEQFVAPVAEVAQVVVKPKSRRSYVVPKPPLVKLDVIRVDAPVAPVEQVVVAETVTVAPEDAVVLQTLAESAAILDAAAPVAKAPKAPKAPRAHHNGDEVAAALHGLTIDQVGDLTRNLFTQACTLQRQGKKAPVNLLSPADRRNDQEAIESALRRAKGLGEYDGITKKANPGSGRMSLGLMIRKYVGMGVALVG